VVVLEDDTDFRADTLSLLLQPAYWETLGRYVVWYKRVAESGGLEMPLASGLGVRLGVSHES